MVQDAASGDVVAAGTSGEKKPGFFARIVIFFRQVIAELRKVVTPTRSELLKFTAVVLGFVVVMMALVYGLDYLFSWVTTVVFGVPA
ncbi:preprotein translocase subunit SecE [Microbacterium paludicola]|uniref:Protein translocase subunit SecE n=1 Tax=Microbacterium paludicola TaxID=300019 RepID=A0A4Y9FYR1_9MICO|nr:preprotein translocase subunit SecE [Microbacterium paludicola]MBF0815918.1 preprotein translocase subunit SecE [Microbacterium paludicola]TFU33389.1 preprotein translocase subunit SecE [Microbacterium paludicola]